MPPKSSRKKAKGKARKANKQPTLKRDGWESLARWGEETATISCNHGAIIPAKGHVVYNYLNALEKAISFGRDAASRDRFLHSLPDFMKQSYEDFPTVYIDTKQRKLAIDIMSSVGTNSILIGGTKDDMIKMKVFINMIVLLEQFALTGEFFSAMSAALVAPEMQNAVRGEQRDMLRFYSKRISCSCLKDKYTDAKETQKKIGICDHCSRRLVRSSLMVCSRCRSCHYCSVGCQHADWPSHKEMCKIYTKLSSLRVESSHETA